VPLKSGLRVIQGHWKWHHSIDRIRVPIRLLFHYNYSSIIYDFQNKARYWLKNANFSYPLPFNLYDHLEPLGILSKILIQTARVPEMVQNIAENFKSLGRVHQRYRRQTDRQTNISHLYISSAVWKLQQS